MVDSLSATLNAILLRKAAVTGLEVQRRYKKIL